MQWPYKGVKSGHEKPLVPMSLFNPVTGQSRRTFGLVDSGSDTCFFDAEIGRSIGIEIEKGKVSRVYGVVPDKFATHYIL